MSSGSEIDVAALLRELAAQNGGERPRMLVATTDGRVVAGRNFPGDPAVYLPGPGGSLVPVATHVPSRETDEYYGRAEPAGVRGGDGDDDDDDMEAACEKGNLARVRKFLDSGAEAGAALDGSGITALFHAASGGHVDVMRLLIERGADPRHANSSGYTAFHVACECGSLEAARLLAEEEGAADVDAAVGDGATPLLLAAQNGHAETVRLVLARRPKDVDRARSAGGPNALYMAVQKMHPETVKCERFFFLLQILLF